MGCTTFNLRRPAAVRVILHTGAAAKPDHPEIVIDDPERLLRWADRNRAVLTFIGDAAVTEALPAFARIATSWALQLR